MANLHDLVEAAHKLSQVAEQASKTGGKRELEALRTTAEEYLKLYQQLKRRGEIE